MHRSARAPGLLAVIGVVLGATACGGQPQSLAPSADATGPAVTAETQVDAATAIDRFDPESQSSWGRASLGTALLMEPDAARSAALERLDAGDPDVRLAAVYALSITLEPEDVEPLAPILESESAAERVLAASAMVALGDGRGVPVLIESLGVDELMPFGKPPLPIWRQARWALLEFTGQDFGLSSATSVEESAATVADWEDWWAGAAGSFEAVRTPGRFGP